MNRQDFLKGMVALMAVPFMPKGKAETGTGLLHQIQNNKSVLSDNLPYKNLGLFIPQGNGRYKHIKMDGSSVEFYEMNWKGPSRSSEVVLKKL